MLLKKTPLTLVRMEDTKQTTSSAEPAAVAPSGFQRWFPRRYVLAILCNLAFFFRGFVVANIGMIIFNHAESSKYNTPRIANFTTEEMQNIVYSYYWVFAIGQIPSAMLVYTYSPQKIMMITMILSFILQIITPWTLTKSITGVVINVFFQGLCLCPLDCACIGLLRRWAPSTERTRLIMLSFTGRYAHFPIAFWISAYLTKSITPNFIYYFAGIAGAVWCILWGALIKDSPPEDEILNSESEENSSCKLKSVPFKSIAMSLPVLCLCLVFASPTLAYKSLMQFILTQNINNVENLGVWTIFINCILFIPIAGFIIDRLINGKKFKTTTIRKVLCSGGLVLHVLFVMLHMIEHDVTSPLCFIVAFLIMDLAAAGIVPNVLDLSSRYSIPIMGLAMTVMTTCGILSDYIHPMIFSKGKDTDFILDQLPMGLFTLITALLFVIFGSAEEQTWSSESLPIHQLQEDVDKSSKNEADEEACTTKNL